MRSRKFLYKTDQCEEREIEFLKTIKCKYHIIDISNKEITGFISFQNARYLTAIKKIINVSTQINTIETSGKEFINGIKKNNIFWENGSFEKNEIDILKDENKELKEEKEELKNRLIEQIETFNKHLIQTLETNHKISPIQTIVKSENIKNLKITNKEINNINLNVFLNNECKDAITIDQFKKSIETIKEDFETTDREGLYESLKQNLKKNLNKYTIEKRPFQCTDKKQKIIYVKDEEEWRKAKEMEIVAFFIFMIENYRSEYSKLVIGDENMVLSDFHDRILLKLYTELQGNAKREKIAEQLTNDLAQLTKISV